MIKINLYDKWQEFLCRACICNVQRGSARQRLPPCHSFLFWTMSMLISTIGSKYYSSRKKYASWLCSVHYIDCVMMSLRYTSCPRFGELSDLDVYMLILIKIHVYRESLRKRVRKLLWAYNFFNIQKTGKIYLEYLDIMRVGRIIYWWFCG